MSQLALLTKPTPQSISFLCQRLNVDFYSTKKPLKNIMLITRWSDVFNHRECQLNRRNILVNRTQIKHGLTRRQLNQINSANTFTSRFQAIEMVLVGSRGKNLPGVRLLNKIFKLRSHQNNEV